MSDIHLNIHNFRQLKKSVLELVAEALRTVESLDDSFDDPLLRPSSSSSSSSVHSRALTPSLQLQLGPSSALSRLLDLWRPDFELPLHFPPPSPQDRQLLADGVGKMTVAGGAVGVDKALVDAAIALSAALEVSERFCAEKIGEGHLLQHRLEMPPLQAAETVYFNERNAFLQTLLTLVKSCADDRLPASFSQAARAFLLPLLSARDRPLQLHLRDLVLRVSALASAHPEHHAYYAAERKLLAECLFYAHYIFPLSSSADLSALLRLLRDLSNPAAPPPSPAAALAASQPVVMDPVTAHFQTCYMVMLTIVCVLSHPCQSQQKALGSASAVQQSPSQYQLQQQNQHQQYQQQQYQQQYQQQQYQQQNGSMMMGGDGMNPYGTPFPNQQYPNQQYPNHPYGQQQPMMSTRRLDGFDHGDYPGDYLNSEADGQQDFSAPDDPFPGYRDASFLSSFNRDLQSFTTPPQSITFISVIWLAWALFLNHHQLERASVTEWLLIIRRSRAPFVTLTKVLDSLVFEQDLDNSPVLVTVIDELIMNYIVDLSGEIRDLKTHEVYALRQQHQQIHQSDYRQNGGRHQISSTSQSIFPCLLQLISSIYVYQPSEAKKFWISYQPYYQFLLLSMPPENFVSVPWFCAFMEMLASLGTFNDVNTGESCSKNAFEFLLQTPNKTVNFNSLIEFLRQKRFQLSSSGGGGNPVRSSRQTQAILPQTLSSDEEKYLIAILHTLQRLMSHDPNIRSQIARNKVWGPLPEIFFGLIASRITPLLKSELLNTVSVFALTPAFIPALWTHLDNAQLLTTASSLAADADAQLLSIRYDLEQVESKDLREYALTRAFVRLLDRLCAQSDAAALNAIGRNHRADGLSPYLAFVRDDIFLKLYARSYQNPGERWHIATYCLRIFIRLLDQADFEPQNGETSYSAELMRNFLGSSGANAMLNVLNQILQDGITDLLAQRFTSPDGKRFESAVLLSLRLLEAVLRHEDAFLDSSRPDQLPEVMTPIHELLETEHERLLTIARYIHYSYNSQLPLFSVRVVYLLSMKQKKLVHILSNSPIAPLIVIGYMDRLEITDDVADSGSPHAVNTRAQYVVSDDDEIEDLWYDPSTTPLQQQQQQQLFGADDSFDATRLLSSGESIDPEIATELNLRRSAQRSVRYAIVRLLVDTVAHPGYNLAHFLLGFHDSIPFDQHELNSPALISCLKAVVALLDHSVHAPNRHPILEESCFELIYRLCADQRTSSSVLRYLRTPSPGVTSSFDRYFLSRQLLQSLSPSLPKATTVYELHKRAWMLKTIALELHGVNFLDHKGISQTLLEMLYLTLEGEVEPINLDDADTFVSLAEQSSSSSSAAQQESQVHQNQILMLRLLDFLEVPLPEAPNSQVMRSGPFQNFDLDACRYLNARGLKLIDVPLLMERLSAHAEGGDARSAQATARRRDQQQIDQHRAEIQRWALQHNTFYEVFGAKQEFFEAWKQILGVTLSRSCFRFLARTPSTWLFDFIELLLRKLASNDTHIPLAEKISTTVLMLMAKLRELKLGSSRTVFTSAAPSQSSAFDAEYLPVDQLHHILKGIIASIFRHGGTQLMRCNLYGTLLHYLKFTQQESSLNLSALNKAAHSSAKDAAKRAANNGDVNGENHHRLNNNMHHHHHLDVDDDEDDDVDVDDVNTPGGRRSIHNGRNGRSSSVYRGRDFSAEQKEAELRRLAEQQENVQRVLETGNRRLILGSGPKFIETLCSDATTGSDLIRSAAFATFDSLMSYDHDHRWLDFLVRRGYMRSFVEFLQKTDALLVQSFTKDSPHALKHLAVFESHISFFLRIGQHAFGASVLMRNGLLQMLGECSCLDHRPDESLASASDLRGLSPSPLLSSARDRYEQLILPVLRLVVSLLASLPENKATVAAVCDFLDAHSDLVSTILQDRGPVTSHSLAELSLVTSIFFHLSRHHEVFMEKLQRKALTFQSMLLQLFAKYARTDFLRHASDLSGDIDPSQNSRSSSGSSGGSGNHNNGRAGNSPGRSDARRRHIDAEKSKEAAKAQDATIREICKNLIALCRILTESASLSSSSSSSSGELREDAGESHEDDAANARPSFLPAKQVSKMLAAQLSWALFSPTISDFSDRRSEPIHGKLPPLSILVHYLDVTHRYLLSSRNEYEQLIGKFENCAQAPREVLHELAARANDSGEPIEDLQTLQHYAQMHLGALIANTVQQIDFAEYAIENSLWVLWRHLVFFLKLQPSPHHSTRGSVFSTSEKQRFSREASITLEPILTQIYDHHTQNSTKFDLIFQVIPRLRNLLRQDS